MKKILSLVLCISIFLSICVVNAEETSNNTICVEAEFLKEIGALDEGFNGNEELKRGEFARYLINILQGKDSFSSIGNSYGFSDVYEDNAISGAIYACKNLGIINGDGSGNFHPERIVTATETVTMLVNALGYKLYAESKGGFEAGYMTIANTIGLFKNTNKRGTDALTKNDGAIFIYNALFADMVSVKSISSTGFELEKMPDKNILGEVLSIYCYDGTVTDNGIASLTGETMGDMKRTVISLYNRSDIVTAYVADSDINSHLGERVRVFVRLNKSNGKNEVVYYSLDKNNTAYTLYSDKIIDVTSSYIEYETNDYNTVKYDISSEAPIVVINGIKTINYDKNTFTRKNSLIKLIDTDNNGCIETIIILDFNGVTSARNIVVDSVDLENRFIKCKFNPVNSLELNEKETILFFSWESDVKKLEDIKPDDIVSVAQAGELYDGKTIYTISVKRNSNTGVISSYTKDSVVINDEEIKVSDSLLAVKPNYISSIEINTEITYMCDVMGNIAYIINPKAKNIKYGYMIGAAVKKDADEYLLIKVYTRKGEFLNLRLAPQTEIDGEIVKTPSEQLSKIKKRSDQSKKMAGDTSISRPIIYKLNKNEEISYIDTDTPNDNVKDNTIYIDQSPISYSRKDIDDEYTLKAGFRNPMVYRCRYNGNVEGRFFLTTDTVILKVPDIDTYGLEDFIKYQNSVSYYDSGATSDMDYNVIKAREQRIEEDNYEIMFASDVVEACEYDIQGYNIDPKTGVASFAIVRGRTDAVYTVGGTENVYLRMTEVYDEPREKIATKLYYTADGVKEEFVLFIKEDLPIEQRCIIFGSDGTDNPFGLKTTALQEGDIIKVQKKGNWLHSLSRPLSINNLKNTNTNLGYIKNSDNPYAQSTFMPYDSNAYKESDAWETGIAYVNSIVGDTLCLFVPKRIVDRKRLIGTIDPTDPTTYHKLYFKISNTTKIKTMDFTKGKMQFGMGTINDVIPYEVTNSLNNTSIIYFQSDRFSISNMMVINGK